MRISVGDSEFYNNYAEKKGGALYLEVGLNTPFYSNPSDVIIDNCKFIENHVTFTENLYNKGAAKYFSSQGGAIYSLLNDG